VALRFLRRTLRLLRLPPYLPHTAPPAAATTRRWPPAFYLALPPLPRIGSARRGPTATCLARAGGLRRNGRRAREKHVSLPAARTTYRTTRHAAARPHYLLHRTAAIIILPRLVAALPSGFRRIRLLDEWMDVTTYHDCYTYRIGYRAPFLCCCLSRFASLAPSPHLSYNAANSHHLRSRSAATADAPPPASLLHLHYRLYQASSARHSITRRITCARRYICHIALDAALRAC